MDLFPLQKICPLLLEEKVVGLLESVLYTEVSLLEVPWHGYFMEDKGPLVSTLDTAGFHGY